MLTYQVGWRGEKWVDNISDFYLSYISNWGPAAAGGAVMKKGEVDNEDESGGEEEEDEEEEEEEAGLPKLKKKNCLLSNSGFRQIKFLLWILKNPKAAKVVYSPNNLFLKMIVNI